MSWLNRLKNQQHPETDATKATELGFVGFVAPILAPIEKTGADSLAANDQAPDPADVGCWPDSTAMNGREIELFTKRVDLFFYREVPLPEAEKLADRLVIRDRDNDDRRICLECRHLTGYSNQSWRCGAWQAAGIATRARDAQLPADLVLQLERCDGFASYC